MKFKANNIWRWYAQKDLSSMSVQLFLMSDGVHGEVFQKRFEEAEVVKHEVGEPAKDGPTMTLDFDEAQFLCDQLFEAGVKPQNMGPSVGQLEAMQNHIDSLQKTVSSLLDPMPKVE